MSKIPEDFFYDETFNPHDWLADYARASGVPANKLFAMGKSNDPFNIGTPKHFEKARWFAGMFARFGYRGIWLRRLHYVMVPSEDPLQLWDGSEYLNTNDCWNKLQESSKLARLLRLVDPYSISEKRNKATPTLQQRGIDVPDPAFETHFDGYGTSLPVAQGPSSMPKVYGFTRYEHPTFTLEGYDYSDELQPILVEIWSEVEDASLHSVAYRHGVNYVPGLGFQSLTAIKALLARLEASDRPARILYISAFDPGGTFMYNSVSRHLHFSCWELEEIAAEVAPSIKVDNVAITREQVEELNIPRIPIKESDPRRAKWELTHGVGGVEVEALEATHPYYLEGLLEGRIRDLQDPTLRRRVYEKRDEANRLMQEKIQEITGPHEEKLRDIRQRSRALARRYRSLYEQLSATTEARYQRLKDRHDRHLAEIESDLQEVEDDVNEKLEDLEVDLLDLPEPTSNEDPSRVWYFDSEREFDEQTEHFRRALGKE